MQKLRFRGTIHMRKSEPYYRSALPCLCGLLIWTMSFCACGADLLDDVSEKLEDRQLQRLARIQDDPNNRIAPFSTDGCSAGLSQGWDIIAKRIPAFAEAFGRRPPWEECCVEHDRRYWRGETEAGFAKRKRADETLRACVAGAAAARQGEWGEQFRVPAADIEGAFGIAAELMYRAVRVGGGPCTGFDWRWGYGWPPCADSDTGDATGPGISNDWEE